MNYRVLAGNRIARAREAIKQENGEPLTQPLLAGRVKGLTKTALSNYEQGIRYAPPHMLVGLSEALNEPASYLGGIVDGPEAELHRAFHKMDQADKEDVLHYVKRRKSLVEVAPAERIPGTMSTKRAAKTKKTKVG